MLQEIKVHFVGAMGLWALWALLLECGLWAEELQAWPPVGGGQAPPGPDPWRLAEQEACRMEVASLCPQHTWNSSMAVLECLSAESELSPECHHLLWNYKLNLTTDPKFEAVAREVCRSDLSELRECAEQPVGKGYLVFCLVVHHMGLTETHCHQHIGKMATIFYSDYRLIPGFAEDCRAELSTFRCNHVGLGKSDAHAQIDVLACLGKALAQGTEGSTNMTKVSPQCKKAILQVAELSAEDFRMDRHLYMACREDRARFCKSTEAGQGRVYKCLFKHKIEDTMSGKCREALTSRQNLIIQDYKASYSLVKSCASDLKKYNSSALSLRLSDLFELLESAMHKGWQVSRECQAEMVDHRRMLMEDVTLSSHILQACREEIDHHCAGTNRVDHMLHCLMKVVNGGDGSCREALSTVIAVSDLGPDHHIGLALKKACESVIQTTCKQVPSGHPGLFSCLMQHLYSEKMGKECENRLLELQYLISRDWKLDKILFQKCQGDALRLCYAQGWNETSMLIPQWAAFHCLYRHTYHRDANSQRVSEACQEEVQKILHQRTMDLKLDPPLPKKCSTDLVKWCSKKGGGHDLKCLQARLDDLSVDCRCMVEFMVELENIPSAASLILACGPIIQTCHQMADNQIGSGNLTACLMENKQRKEMNGQCAAAVDVFQLAQMNDFRFYDKFNTACKEDVLKHCPNSKKKVDVVNCLSSVVLNNTLESWKGMAVSLECRKRLNVEELVMSEDIRLQPDLYEHCKKDIQNFCQDVPYGDAQIMECLKDNINQVTLQCHQKLFKLQEKQMMDPKLDYTLMRACKQMIDRFCRDSSSKYVLLCLKQTKNSETMDSSCKQIITKREIVQNTDFRFNPELRKACNHDIARFCEPLLDSGDFELEGQVISCLKMNYANQSLSADCEDQVRVILQESALDYRLDRQLQIRCSGEISRLCSMEVTAQEQTGLVLECLNMNLLEVQTETCQQYVIGLLESSKDDIFVDPVLIAACALDIKSHCGGIPPGLGRQTSCLLAALESKMVRLQPKCKTKLYDRQNIWRLAASLSLSKGYADIAMQTVTAPSNNNIFFVIIGCVCFMILILVGLLLGLYLKRGTNGFKSISL